MLKRVVLFLATNFLVIVTISIVFNLLGLNTYLQSYGLNYTHLLIFCTIWGMGGAFVSLWISKWMAKMAMGVVVINPNSATNEERFLLEIVFSLARRVGLTTMPEVGIYHSNEVNAFATGPTKNNALVAVSSGLLANMNRDEIEGVLGHEISHVSNGDMVTMTLVQGIINAFALFLSRIFAYAISIALSRGEERENISYATYGIFAFIFDILFTFLGMILVAAFSRWREYRADAGGAKLAGRDKMIAALERLGQAAGIQDKRAPALQNLKISDDSRWLGLFSTHPSIPKRIARLQAMRF